MKTLTASSKPRFPRALSAAVSAVLIIGAIATPAMAASQDPSGAQHNSSVKQIAGGSSGANPGAELRGAAPQPSSGLEKTAVGGLPFTGLDLIALVAVAVALTTMGFALRRLTYERQFS